jgi:hypothetical protein
LLDLATKGLNLLADSLDRVTKFAKQHPEITRFAAQAMLGITALAGLSGGMFLLNHSVSGLTKPLIIIGRITKLLVAADSLPMLATTLAGLPEIVIGAIAAITAYSAYGVYDWYKNGKIDDNYKTATGIASKGASSFNVSNPNALNDYRHLLNPERYPDTIRPAGKGQTIQVHTAINLDRRQIGKGITEFQATEAVRSARSSMSTYDPTMTPPTVGLGR